MQDRRGGEELVEVIMRAMWKLPKYRPEEWAALWEIAALLRQLDNLCEVVVDLRNRLTEAEEFAMRLQGHRDAANEH